MSDSSVRVLYKCIVCGKAWSKAQSLRAHMKVHRGEGYVGTSIVVKKDLWTWFKSYCNDHNTTTCHLFNALLEMARKGTDEGVIVLGAPNPIQVIINETFLGKPRSGWKVPVPPGLVSQFPAAQPCHLCGSPAQFRAWFKPATARWRPRFMCAGCLDKNRDHVKVSARL